MITVQAEEGKNEVTLRSFSVLMTSHPPATATASAELYPFVFLTVRSKQCNMTMNAIIMRRGRAVVIPC
jgi:hypothetical protein